MKPVLLIGNHIQALGIIRSLGRKGIDVYLLNNRSLCIGRFSSYLKGFIKVPSIRDEDIFIKYLIKISNKKHLKDGILIPTNDAAVYFLSKYKQELEKYYTVTTPLFDIVEKAYNKKLTYQLAESIGIIIPKTYYPEDINDLNQMELKYPVIIKPAIMHSFYEKVKVKVFKVNNKKELIEKYKIASDIIDPSEILIQEIIPGGPENLYSFCSFYKKNEIIGMFMGKRSRQKPMDFGKASTFVTSVFVPELIEPSEKFLHAINYYGLSEIEFKMDPRDGIFKMLEMNPRTWLWHSLATRCGVDFPYLLYSDLNSKPINHVLKYKKNINFIHMYTDISVVLPRLMNGKMNLKDYLLSLKGEKEFAVFSFDDPLPFIAETLLLPYLWGVR